MLRTQPGLPFGFIGVGQAGGNLANEFARKGYPAIAINTAETDLTKLNAISKGNRLLISVDGIQGAGKNPDVGRRALESHVEDVLRLVGQVFDPAARLFVCAGLGGGTGSGVAPLLTAILSEEERQVGAIVTLPSEMESPKVKLVALRAFEELSAIAALGSLFIVDNAKGAASSTGLQARYAAINSAVADLLDQVNCLTTQPSETAFDARDLATLLAQRGAAVLSATVLDDAAELQDAAALTAAGIDSLRAAVYADTDIAAAGGIALLLEMPEGGKDLVTEASLARLQHEFGVPFETSFGLYENKQWKKKAVLHLLVTGLPFPTTRLASLESQMVSRAQELEARLERAQTQVYSGQGSALLDRFLPQAKPAAPSTPTAPKKLSTLEQIRQKHAR